ncbi:hypothetical protein E3Q02_01791 [Wallemia mellicola]|uniref:Cytochrome b561 domain-containing protein n=1 Tax=Wallemia mellicola TaxID=1708541 RepID=A0AB38MYZ5_9BASI|nr:hypothetical protein E3Q02_01791 [Wallemia mellicola]
MQLPDTPKKDIPTGGDIEDELPPPPIRKSSPKSNLKSRRNSIKDEFLSHDKEKFGSEDLSAYNSDEVLKQRLDDLRNSPLSAVLISSTLIPLTNLIPSRSVNVIFVWLIPHTRGHGILPYPHTLNTAVLNLGINNAVTVAAKPKISAGCIRFRNQTPSIRQQRRESVNKMSDANAPLLNSRESTAESPNSVSIDNVALIVALLSALSLVATPAIFILNSGGYGNLGPFVFHPLFQTFGLTVLVIAVLTLQPATAGTRKVRSFERHRKLIGYLALPAFLVGSSAMFYNKHLHGALHFTTWHSTAGLSVGVLLTIQSLVGLGFTMPSKEKPLLPKTLYKYHRLSGYFILLPLLLLTVALGVGHSTWATTQASLTIRVLFVDLPALLIVLSLWARLRKQKLGL